MKTIKFYVRSTYGVQHEFVVDGQDAQLIRQLTGKLTITATTREALRTLSGGAIVFEQVIDPKAVRV